MAERVASIRNENVLLLNAAAKSEHARAQVNQVYMREKADGTRTCIQVYGVAVPKVFAPKSVADAAVDSLISSQLSIYTTDTDKRIQFATIESVLDKAITMEQGTQRQVPAGETVPVVVIDFLDAISVTKGLKRTPCRLRVFSKNLFFGIRLLAIHRVV